MRWTVLCLALLAVAAGAATESPRHRLIVLADMGNEPDEEQQMVHMLMCSNEFDVEGLIAVTGKYLRRDPRPDLFLKLIDGYEKVVDNLKLHAQNWPTPEHLRSVTKPGQPAYGMADVGEGHSSPGSKLIIDAVTKSDPRPIWVVVNAGSNTLAQALVDYQTRHTPAEVNAFVAKLRVFENGSQDNAGAWICSRFPKIHWIRSNYQTYAYGGPGSRDGDTFNNLGPYYWKPYENTPAGQHGWLQEHVQTGHGALGELYPDRTFRADGKLSFMEGGGTIPWLGLVNKGLFDIDQPSWGGWSGRFSAKKVADFWSRHADIKPDEQNVAPFYTYREVSDTWVEPDSGEVLSGDYVPVWRWRKATYTDFQCRMDWCVKPFSQANHHPKAAFHGDRSDAIVRVTARPGEMMALDASATTDPDGDRVDFSWWVYEEAGTYPGDVVIHNPEEAKASVQIPTGAGGKQIHVVLEVKDRNSIAPLFDYRRIVIDVMDAVVEFDSTTSREQTVRSVRNPGGA